MSKIQFGVQFKPEFKNFQEAVEAFQSAQGLGFVSAWLYDHLYSMGRKPSLEGWTTLAALAAATKEIRLGVLVTCNSFRYPQVLAKMASTVDLISKGRLEFGIGAGWYQEEYEAYGIPFPSFTIRMEQLEEALKIIIYMWTQDKASFQGRHYSIIDLELEPKTFQKPHPPIWIGGKPLKLLSLVAEYGNAANFVYISPDESKTKNQFLNEECHKLGRSYKDIIKSWHGSFFLSDNSEKSKIDALKKKASSINQSVRSLPNEQYLKKVIYGTPDQCIERIQQFIDADIDYFILAEPSMVRPELQRFSKEVIRSFI